MTNPVVLLQKQSDEVVGVAQTEPRPIDTEATGLGSGRLELT